jgi:protein TonB
MAEPTTSNGLGQRGTEPDWRAPPPALSIRVLLCVAVIVPLLLAAGVYWVRHTPDNRALAAGDGVVEVQVIPLRDHVPEVRTAAVSANQAAALPSPAVPLVEDPKRAIPNQAALTPALPVPAPMPSPAAEPPAVSGAPEQRPTAQTAAAFQQRLLLHIARFQFYPDDARRERVQGTVQLMFAMRRDGTVSDVWVKRSSGSSILDRAAIETVRNAQPLPRIPAELPGTLNILVPVAFVPH